MKPLHIIALMLLLSGFARAQTSQPALIDASDKAALTAHLGQDVFVHGVISTAEWSRTGAVMNIEFKNNQQSRMLAVVFQRNKAKLDEAYGGDLAKTLAGAKVRIHGKLEEYGGQVAAMKGRPQIIINIGAQITIYELAPSSGRGN